MSTTYGPTDWHGANFLPLPGDYVYGVHTNVKDFVIPLGTTLLVTPYNGSIGGFFDITCLNAKIFGTLDATGAGYQGGGGGGGAGSPATGSATGGQGGSGGNILGVVGVAGISPGSGYAEGSNGGPGGVGQGAAGGASGAAGAKIPYNGQFKGNLTFSGFAGGNGKYTATADTSTTQDVLMGSGGGGGGGNGSFGGKIQTFNGVEWVSIQLGSPVKAASGGGAGASGGGTIIIRASVVKIVGTILSNDALAGNGGIGGVLTGQTNVGTHGGGGGGGGSATGTATVSGGTGGGSAPAGTSGTNVGTSAGGSSTFNEIGLVATQQGGAGGRGGGGGVLIIFSKKLAQTTAVPKTSITGTINNYGGAGVNNAGTLKIFSTKCNTAMATLQVGRKHSPDNLADKSAMPPFGAIT